MKLCPECAFIYEDNQSVCDMDGQKLVPDPGFSMPEPTVSAPSRLTIGLPAKVESSPGGSGSRRLPVLMLLLVFLITVLSVIVLAQVRRSRASHAAQSPRSAATDINLQPAANAVPSTSVAVAAPEESPELPQETAPANALDTSTNKRTRLASSAISAGAPGASSHSVILHLSNGAIINADEVWERKEGIWYRQAGMVTFLKRSRVTAIERSAPPRAPEKTTANAEARISKTDDRTAQNQLRLRRLEPVETKKPSRVKSFLKLTGRMLKKPFKL